MAGIPLKTGWRGLPHKIKDIDGSILVINQSSIKTLMNQLGYRPAHTDTIT
jgi:hypothetical protein